LQAHLQLFFSGRNFFTAAKELASFQPEKNFNFFSPALKEKIKAPDTQANDNADRQNKYHNRQTRHCTRTDRRAAGNSGFALWRGKWVYKQLCN